ncbi:hypothetical protein DFH05DRAFT_1407484, partial [Lentinula detonsa]
EEIVLMIPHHDKTNERKTYNDRDVDYDTVMEDIYEAIGCKEAKAKPAIGYKIEGSPAKTGAISLMSSEDWEGLCDDVLEKQEAKSKVFKINIIVAAEVPFTMPMPLLEKDGKGKERSDRKSSKKKKNAVKSFKFDSDSDSEDDSNDGMGKSTMDKETRFIGELTSTYGNCALCKPKICKIGQGIHVSLTFNMRAAWAAALAHEEAGVTLSTPPKTEQFRQFHHSIELPTLVSNLSDPTTPSFGSNMSVMKEFVAPIIGAFAAVNQLSNPRQNNPETPTPHARPVQSPQCVGIPSSNGFDEQDINPYPTIDDFFTSLDVVEPQCNLSRYVATLTGLDFYNIDNIAGLTVRVLQDDVGMSLGNATHVLNMVKKKIHVVNKGRKEFRNTIGYV